MELLGNNPSMQDLIEKLNEVVGSLNNSLPNTDSELAEVKKLVSFGSNVLAGRLNAKLWYFKTQELMTASTELCEGDSCFVLKDGVTTGEGTFEYWYIYKTSDVADIIDSYVDLSNPDLVAVKLQDMTLKDVKDTLSAQISNQSKDLNTKISNLRKDTETALLEKADLINGLIPASQLPSYVDDIIESWLEDVEFPENAYAKEDTEMTTPLTPEFSKIYVNLLNNKTYRWGGSFYVEVSKSLAIGETATTAFAGDRGKTLETKIQNSINYVTPEMFGAKGDGMTDDTNAIQSAIDSGNPVLLMSNYLISSITIPTASVIVGSSVKTHVFVNGNGIVINGHNVKMSEFTIETTLKNKTAITFSNNAFEGIYDHLIIVNFNTAFSDSIMCFNNTFNNIRCIGCEKAFVFENDTVSKTSMFFNKCYAENCGQSYYFNNMVYSTLNNCSADYNSYKRNDNPYGDGGHGTTDNLFGVYTFINSKGVSMLNCGTENSYGTGAVCLISSRVNINGLSVANLKTTRTVSDNYPDYRIGIINIDEGTSIANISNVNSNKISCDNFTSHIPFIGYNALTTSQNQDYSIICDNIQAEYDDFVFGQSYYNGKYDVINLNKIKDIINETAQKSWKKVATSTNLVPNFDVSSYQDVLFEFIVGDRRMVLELSVSQLTTSGQYFYGTGTLEGYFATGIYSLNKLEVDGVSYINNYTVNIYAR